MYVGYKNFYYKYRTDMSDDETIINSIRDTPKPDEEP